MAYTFKHGDRPLEGITVQRAVGRGGFGEVYYSLADSGKQVALKYLRENPEIELRGIAHVMNLKSPHLITIYDVKRNAANEPFVIMEYVSGPSLRELMLAEPGGMGVQKAAFFLKGIASGLSYLHERGIVHRDLKPANIFYDDGYVKIGDYGLSKHMSISKHSGQTVSVGTVHYMAPEIGSGSYTRAIDIYALGVILFEMLTGNLPFSGSSMAEILMRHLRDNPDLSGIPKPFAPVIAKALAKDPTDRYQTADEMLAAVMELAEISQSIESFDASALSQVPRSPEANDVEPTVTSPHRPPPVPLLDAREARPLSELPERLQRKLDQLTRKLDQRAAKLEKRFGPRRGQRQARPPRPEKQRDGIRRRPQIFILLMVAVAVSVTLSLLRDPNSNHVGERAVAFGLFIVAGTLGPLLAYFRFLKRALARSPILDRLAYGALAAIFMFPAYMIASEEVRDCQLAQLIFAPLVVLLLCNWTERIEAGRRGEVTGGAAVWPAILGLIVAAIVDSESYLLSAAVVCGVMSLLTQATASMWPLTGTAPPPGPPSPPQRPGPETEDEAVTAEEPAARTDEVAYRQGESAAAGAPAPASGPSQVSAMQPSFAGRTANAGIGYLGKLLMLAALVFAIGQPPLSNYAARNDYFGDSDLKIVLGDSLPPGLVMIPLVLGGLLLLIARRRDGGWHFLRGCLGCGLISWSALAAMIWARDALVVMFTRRDWSSLKPSYVDQFEGGMWLVLTILPLILGVVMLLWPAASQRNRAIVV